MGLHVLNTRPAERAGALTQALLAADCRVSELALLTLQACELTVEDQAALQQFAQHALTVVISPTAAQLGLAHLERLGVRVHDVQMEWIAVGQATAQRLRQAGLDPEVPTLETSEGVVALPAFNRCVASRRVMIWRGEAGRDLIQLTLQQQAVDLSNLALYRRIKPVDLAADWSKILAVHGWPDVVLISSGEAWQHWQQLTTEAATRPWLLVLGQRLYQQLQSSTSRLSMLQDLQPATIQQALTGVIVK